MPTLCAPLVLASSSPRRREILATLGLPHLVEGSGIPEERAPDESPVAYARRLAAAKATDVAGRFAEGVVVLGADTIVVVEGDVLEKAATHDEAAAMIARLAGRTHEVVTAVALVQRPTGVIAESQTTTRVTFRALTSDEIARYAGSGDGDGKAGAYAVQGLGAGLVERVEGSYTNVVGLPATEVLALLRAVGVLEQWP
jgi:septum formation protein